MRPYTSCLCLRAELVQENREMMTLLSYLGEDTQTHADAHTHRVMLHFKFRNYLQRCTVCSASFLGFYSCSEAALQRHFHLQCTITHMHCLPSVVPAAAAFFLPLLLLKTHTQAPARRALRKTKSCAVRRCQRRAPTHAAPSEYPAIAAVANCAVVKGTAPQ